MAYTSDPNRAKKIVDYLNANPGYDPDWAKYKQETETYGSPGQYAGYSPQALLDAYGGYWDRKRGRAPGAEHSGSVQKHYDDIFVASAAPPAPGGTTPPGAGTPYRGIRPPGPIKGLPAGGGNAMPQPQDPGGSSQWQQWLAKVRGWTPPEETQMDLPTSEGGYGVGISEAKALAYINNLLAQTGASGFLSPFYINRLRGAAARPMNEQALRMAAGGQTPTTGGYGGFLQDWLGSSRTGMGTLGYGGAQGLTQSVIDRLQAGRVGAQGGATGPNVDLWNLMGSNPPMLENFMRLGIGGPFAGAIRNALYQSMTTAPSISFQDPTANWLDYVLSNTPGLGYQGAGGRGW